MLRSAAKFYTHALEINPWTVNIASAFVIFSAGDVTAQYIEHKEKKTAEPFMVDGFRMVKVVNWSVFIYTPVFFKLYQKFDLWWPKKTPLHVFKKVLSASALAIPTNTIFFGYNAAYPHVVDFVVGNSDHVPYKEIGHKAMKKVDDDLITTQMASMSLWWPVNACNFAFVPGTYRSVWTSAWSIVWSTYLSLVAHRDPEEIVTSDGEKIQRREEGPLLSNNLKG